MASTKREYVVDGVTINSKPQRPRRARPGHAGYEMDTVDPNQLLPIMTDTDITLGSGSDGQSRTQTNTQSKPKVLRNYEYLDHTADIQLHAWGANMGEAFSNVALCMFNYMTSIDQVDSDPAFTTTMTIEATDIEKLLFKFMDELLYQFLEEKRMVCCEIEVIEADWESCKLTAVLKGEVFDLNKHEKGTEIKAITYSATQFVKNDDRVDIYMIVDI